jgi:hypothetical protein
MTHLWPKIHNVQPERGLMIEIHHPVHGLIGAIYPTERGVRIVSKYLDAFDQNLVALNPTEPPALEVFIV